MLTSYDLSLFLEACHSRVFFPFPVSIRTSLAKLSEEKVSMIARAARNHFKDETKRETI